MFDARVILLVMAVFGIVGLVTYEVSCGGDATNVSIHRDYMSDK